jgi:hypothetical protein
MTDHNLFYYPYASFTNAQLPLLKVAALYFDKLVILDPVGASWDTVGADHLARHLTRFHGVFAPNARLRPVVTRLGRPAEESPPPPRPCPHGASPAAADRDPGGTRPPLDGRRVTRQVGRLTPV